MNFALRALSAAAVAASGTAHAAPAYIPDLTELSQRSNVVVVANVVDNTVVSAGVRQVTLNVERSVAGASGWDGKVIGYAYPQGEQSSGPVVGTRGMFFLQCAAACQPAADIRQYVLAGTPGEPLDASVTDGATRVANELLPILKSPTESSERRHQAAMLLAVGKKNETIQARLKQILSTASTSSATRLAAFAVLANWDDLSQIDLVTPDVTTAADEPMLTLIGSGVRSVEVISPTTLAAFAQWLQAPSPEIRRAGASALRDIGGKDAGYALARYGLEDADKEVLFYTIVGLIGTFGDTGRYASMDGFEADPRPYVARWKAWRTKHM